MVELRPVESRRFINVISGPLGRSLVIFFIYFIQSFVLHHSWPVGIVPVIMAFSSTSAVVPWPLPLVSPSEMWTLIILPVVPIAPVVPVTALSFPPFVREVVTLSLVV